MLSEKQIDSYQKSNCRFNIWVGSIRSGKTHLSILKFLEMIKEGPKGDAMIIGVSRESIQRNILNQTFKFLGSDPPGSKTSSILLYGRRIYFCGANDEGSVRRIKGSTLALAYVDEATDIPFSFWQMLIGRLSIRDAKLYATCNPEGPAHWLKKEYIDNKELNLVHFQFQLDDNPTLSDDYKASIKKEYHGMWYKRYILGEWAVAHGLIYDNFDENNLYDQKMVDPKYRIVGVDYGTSNATAAVLVGINPSVWPFIRIEQEYYYDSYKKGRSKTDSELADDIEEFIKYQNVDSIYLDPSAASLKAELFKRDLPVFSAKNDVLQGIKTVSKMIGNKDLVVHKRCKMLRECIYSYSWDAKAANKGIDKPEKEKDHIMDALRYAIYSAFPHGTIQQLSDDLIEMDNRDKLFREHFMDNRENYFSSFY